MLRSRIFVLLGALALGCGPHLQQAYAPHVLPLDKYGKIANIEVDTAADEPTGNLRDTAGEPAIDKQIARVVEGILRTPLRRIAIYVHGGLVSLSSSIDEAEALVPAMLADQVYPVLVSWETGGGSAYGEHLITPRGGRSSDRSIYKAKPISEVPLDLFSLVAELPRSYAVAVADSARSNRHFHLRRAPELLCVKPAPGLSMARLRSALFERPRTLCAEPFPDCDGQPHFVCSSAYERASRKASRRHMLAWIGTSPAKLLSAPVVYALGPELWDVLVRRSRLVFHRQNEFHDAQSVDPSRATGALARFLDRLNEEFKKLPNRDEYEFVLIGHSMGAIVLNEVLSRYTRADDIRFHEIAYLAAAASTRDSLEAVVRYLGLPGNKNTQFYNLSLHPMAEDRESSLGGVAPDGSLLVWIDSMFQNPPSFLERTFGRWENVRPALHLIPTELRERMHFRVLGLDNGDPQSHAAFNDTCRRFWRRSYLLGSTDRCD